MAELLKAVQAQVVDLQRKVQTLEQESVPICQQELDVQPTPAVHFHTTQANQCLSK